MVELNNGAKFYLPNNLNNNQHIKCLEVDSLNNIWVSYTTNDGVYKFDGVNWTNYTYINSNLPNNIVNQIILEPNTNAIWFCTNLGFAKYINGVWYLINTNNSKLPTNAAKFIYFYNDSIKIYGCNGGFSIQNKNIWNNYLLSNSNLSNDIINSILIDNNCTAWFTTQNGICSASMDCGLSSNTILKGKIFKSNTNSVAINVLVELLKLENNHLNIIDNINTDTLGNYSFNIEDTGSYYLQAVVNDSIYPNYISVYQDSAIIIQQSKPLIIDLNTKIINQNLYLVNRNLESNNGICNYQGQLLNIDSNQRIENQRILLFKNNYPVASCVTDQNGYFNFTNLNKGVYQIKIDNIKINNNMLLNVIVNCNNEIDTFLLNENEIIFSNSNNNILIKTSKLTIFPNPTNDFIYILEKPYLNKNENIFIYDILSHKLNNFQIINNNIIDISNFKAGLYIIKIY